MSTGTGYAKHPVEIILESDPKAAQLVTMSLWQSRTGRLFLDESVARADGATHRRCAGGCGAVLLKHGLHICPGCQEKRTHAAYNKLERAPWDGTPVCTYNDDRYFFSWEDVLDFCDDAECKPEDLMLVHTRGVRVAEIDPYDLYCDDLSEDEDLPREIVEAFEKLNETIRECTEALHYMPTQVAVWPLPGEGEW